MAGRIGNSQYHPSLKGRVLDTQPPPVFCAIDVIIGRYRVFILSTSRVFIISLCCVQFLVCVMFSFVVCVVCSFSTTTRPTADGGRFAPAGLASRARSIAHCALPQVPPPVQYEGGGDSFLRLCQTHDKPIVYPGTWYSAILSPPRARRAD